jgi:ADP-ribose pyrophosphatase YjhB (NUDIX family)
VALFHIHVSVLVERAGTLLLVQEQTGRWNLPGGHLEEGEGLVAGGVREVREETGLVVEPDYLLGIYTGYRSAHLVNFVFHAVSTAGTPVAEPEEVTALRWFTPAELLRLPAGALLNPRKLRRIVEDFCAGQVLPLQAIVEDVYGA